VIDLRQLRMAAPRHVRAPVGMTCRVTAHHVAWQPLLPRLTSRGPRRAAGWRSGAGPQTPRLETDPHEDLCRQRRVWAWGGESHEPAHPLRIGEAQPEVEDCADVEADQRTRSR